MPLGRPIPTVTIGPQGKTIAIDGKTLRGSRDQANGKSAIHLVSAWASDIRLVLANSRPLTSPTKSPPSRN